MSSIYKKAIEALNTRLDLTCFDFPHTVEVLHSDRSHFLFKNAKMEAVHVENVPFLFVWTEHCGYHAFFQEDLEWWTKYEDVNKN
jgi:hypothetical protein